MSEIDHNSSIPDLAQELEIINVSTEEMQKDTRELICEVPLTIFINGEEFVTLLCSPCDQKELAVGFLRSEGLITDSSDLLSLELDAGRGLVNIEVAEHEEWGKTLNKKRTITSGCGGGTTLYRASDALNIKKNESSILIEPAWIISSLNEMQKKSFLYYRTRGAHSSALAREGEIILFAQDIGRHNAVDKLIGRALLEEIKLEGCVICSSGRISSEILLKAARMNIPAVISRAAPTSLSVRLGKELGITVVGFVTGKSFKVFSHPERVITP